MKCCVVGVLQMAVLSFEFHQNRLSGFGAVGVEICLSPLTWPLAYTTACTTVQAVMWADAQRDGRPAEYRWHLLQKFSDSIPCIMPQSLANARCWGDIQ